MITIQDTIYMGTAAPASGSGGGSITVDQTYDATSTNAQSGIAVAEAIATVALTAGSNIAINNGVISATDTTYSAFTGATSSVAGSAGLVPAPTTGDVDNYLKGDGTWAVPSIANMQTTTNLVTSVSSSSTDAQYPSAKLFYDTVGNIETLLAAI